MSFLSQNEKNECDFLLDEFCFNTFKEPQGISIYLTPERTIISTDSNFIFAFETPQPGSDIQYVTQSGHFDAVVEYEANLDSNDKDFPLNQSIPLKNAGLIRISVSGEGAYAMLKNSEKVTFDGQNFNIYSDIVKRGMFTRHIYDCWLQKID